MRRSASPKGMGRCGGELYWGSIYQILVFTKHCFPGLKYHSGCDPFPLQTSLRLVPQRNRPPPQASAAGGGSGGGSQPSTDAGTGTGQAAPPSSTTIEPVELLELRLLFPDLSLAAATADTSTFTADLQAAAGRTLMGGGGVISGSGGTTLKAAAVEVDGLAYGPTPGSVMAVVMASVPKAALVPTQPRASGSTAATSPTAAAVRALTQHLAAALPDDAAFAAKGYGRVQPILVGAAAMRTPSDSSSSSLVRGLPDPALIGIAAGGGALLTACVAVLLVVRHRRKRRARAERMRWITYEEPEQVGVTSMTSAVRRVLRASAGVLGVGVLRPECLPVCVHKCVAATLLHPAPSPVPPPPSAPNTTIPPRCCQVPDHLRPGLERTLLDMGLDPAGVGAGGLAGPRVLICMDGEDVASESAAARQHSPYVSLIPDSAGVTGSSGVGPGAVGGGGAGKAGGPRGEPHVLLYTDDGPGGGFGGEGAGTAAFSVASGAMPSVRPGARGAKSAGRW